MISCVVFDFDGTLVLSNDIKRDMFYTVAGDFPEGRARMDEVLRTHSGDRAAIFSRFAEVMGIPKRAAELVDVYTRLCHERIRLCPQRSGAQETLHALRSAGARLYVNSSTPDAPLQRAVDERFGGLFDGVMGGHGRKLANLHAIAEAERLDPNRLLMVGDGLDDYEAAMSFGAGFVGVSGGTLAANTAAHVVEDLGDVLPMIAVDRVRV